MSSNPEKTFDYTFFLFWIVLASNPNGYGLAVEQKSACFFDK